MNERVKSQLRRELSDLFGPRRFIVENSPTHRFGVVFPNTVAEVQQVARLTRDAKVPLIPRGATTNPFAGLEPDQGLVVAFDRLSRIRRVNVRNRLVLVGPGVIWRTLSEDLAGHGLMLRVYPSSEGFSTVGGFIAQGGLGIGSYAFGEATQNVASVRLVDANGELRTIGKKELGLVVGAQGRTGFVVEAELILQELAPMAQLTALFDSFAAAEKTIADISKEPQPIWSVNLMDEAGVALQSRNWPDMPIPRGKSAALFTFRDSDAPALVPTVKSTVAAQGGTLLESGRAISRRLTQFASMQVLGTTPMPMQFRVPLGRTSEMVGKVPPEIRSLLAMEAVIGQAGRTIAVRFFFTHRQTLETNGRAAGLLLELAKEVGGSTYTTGAAYLQEAQALLGAEHLRQLADFRRLVDPDDRLNPGRAFASAATAAAVH